MDGRPTPRKTLRSTLAAGLAVALLACACGRPRAPAPTLPPFVHVEVRGALLGPSKVSGAAWDGLGQLDYPAQAGLARALTALNPYAAVLSFFSNPAMNALERPEPFGYVRASVNGVVVQHLELPVAQRDTLTPIWSNARLVRVPLVVDTRLEVELFDDDLVEDDAMGAATVTASDIATALRIGTVHHVRVAEQANNQILFVDVSVEAAP